MSKTVESIQTIQTKALALLADIRSHERHAVESLRSFGALLYPISLDPQAYFPNEKVSESRKSYRTWYEGKLGVNGFYVNNAIGMHEASLLVTKRVAAAINTGVAKESSPIVRQTAEGSTKLLPKAERQKNTRALFAKAEELCKADEAWTKDRPFRAADVRKARAELFGIKESGRSASKHTLVKVMAELEKVDFSILVDITADDVATIQAFAANVEASWINQESADVSEAEVKAS